MGRKGTYTQEYVAECLGTEEELVAWVGWSSTTGTISLGDGNNDIILPKDVLIDLLEKALGYKLEREVW